MYIMYVCMYVCMHVCMYVYVCIYVCMYVCMYVRTYMCVCIYVYVCMYVRMYVSIYVCVCIMCVHMCMCMTNYYGHVIIFKMVDAYKIKLFEVLVVEDVTYSSLKLGLI